MRRGLLRQQGPGDAYRFPAGQEGDAQSDQAQPGLQEKEVPGIRETRGTRPVGIAEEEFRSKTNKAPMAFCTSGIITSSPLTLHLLWLVNAPFGKQPRELLQEQLKGPGRGRAGAAQRVPIIWPQKPPFPHLL